MEDRIVRGWIFLGNGLLLSVATVFGWGTSALLLVFVIDYLGTVLRHSVDRLVASRPRGEAERAVITASGYLHFPIAPELLEKRWSHRITGFAPAIHLRNVPYVLEWFYMAAMLSVGVAVVLLYTADQELLRVSENLLPWIALVTGVLLMRHPLTVAAWSRTGRYEKASAPSARPKPGLLIVCIVAIAPVVFVAPFESGLVLPVAIVVLLKTVVDLRESDVGPAWLNTDRTSEIDDCPIAVPVGSPVDIVGTNRLAMFAGAIPMVAIYTVFPGVVLIAGVFLVGLVYFDPAILFPATVLLVFVMILGFRWLVLELAHGCMEYRVYDDLLLAYDTRLEEAQWMIPRENVTQTTVTHGRLLPGDSGSVTIQQADGANTQLRYVSDPNRFVDLVGR